MKFAKLTTIPPNSETVLTTRYKSAETFIVEAKRELALRTCSLIAQTIIEILRNRPFYVLVAILTQKGISVPKHTSVAKLTEVPTVTREIMKTVKSGSRPYVI